MLAILCGNPWDGFKIHGPFDSLAEAESYQNTHLFSREVWWIMKMTKEV